jgi:hypothetical protein
MSAIPIAGDITGLAADAAMYSAYPEERTIGNYAMSALGVLPLVPGAAALRAARGAASPLEGVVDAPTISSRSKTSLDPNSLSFRESEQNRLEQASELFDSGEEISPIVTIYNNGRRDILDGHNRASIAISRKQNLPAVDIDIAEYERLKRAGFDDMEIAYATLLRADEDDAASAINKQFYGSGISQRGVEALSLMDSPAPASAAPSPLEGAMDMSTDARMQRAAEQGFNVNTPVYHGTAVDFKEFDPDRSFGSQFWSTTDKAAIEAGEVGAAGRGVIKEMFQRIKNPAGWAEYDKYSTDELIARGYDGLALPDADGQITYVAFEPNQYRDVRAAFDPAKRSSANLLATAAGGTISLSALRQLMPQEEERPIE